MYITQGLPETLPIKKSLSLNNDIQMKYMYMYNGPGLNLNLKGGGRRRGEGGSIVNNYKQTQNINANKHIDKSLTI